MEKIMVFVDGNNFYRGCKDNLGRVDVDIAKLGHIFAKILSGTLIRTYYYNAWISDRFDPIGHEKQRKFFESLERAPQVTVKFGRLIYHPMPHRKRHRRADRGGHDPYRTPKSL